MRVIAHVLRKIDDEQSISLQAATSPAIAELFNGYNEMAAVARAGEDDKLVLATGTMYGQDFKRLLIHVPSFDLHRMLDRYLSHFAHCEKGNATRERGQPDTGDDDDATEETFDVPDTPKQKEKRRFHQSLMRAGVALAIGVFFVVGGAMVAVLAHQHKADNAVFAAIMSTATELLKILFMK